MVVAARTNTQCLQAVSLSVYRKPDLCSSLEQREPCTSELANAREPFRCFYLVTAKPLL